MSLNCKQGDLARVIYAPDLPPGSEGHICRCLEPEAHPFWGTPGWLIDPPLPGDNDCILDAMLRPIRGQEGDDETLAWVGKPAQVDASEVIPA